MKYLDTSAFVKHYRKEEEGSDKINDIINAAKDGKDQLMSSFFVVGETLSVFDKWVRYKYFSGEEYAELITIFLKDLKELTDSEALVLEPVSTSTIVSCLDLISKHHMSINDAIHLYTALSNKTLIEIFVCSDKILLKAAEQEGFSILNPEKK